MKPTEGAFHHRFIDGALLRRRGMHPPAVAATRLFYGTGVGLLLGVGFALQAGRLPQTQPPVLLAFVGLSVLMLGAGWSVSNGVGPLARRFSYESDAEMAARVQEEIEDVQHSESVNAKWAALEANVLVKDLGEDE